MSATQAQTEAQNALFELAACALIERRVPVIPLRPRTKTAFMSNWQDLATVDRKQIGEWAAQYPDANVACVAKAEPNGMWFFEYDAPDFYQEIERQTGQKMPVTFRVQSSSQTRGHFYFTHNAASIAMGNLQAEIEGKEAWSARVHNKYVVGPGSVHPTTGTRYTVLVDAPIVEAPEWLIEWLKKNAGQSESASAATSQAMVPEGRRSSTLISIAGSYLDLGEKPEQVKERISELNQERCSPPLSEGELTKTIFASIDRYAQKPDAITRMATEIIPFVGSSKTGSTEQKGRMMDFVRGDSIQPQRLKWLWRGRIVADKLNVFSGEPDVGKGMTTCDFAARLTRHLDFPDCKNELDGPKDVVFLSDEDDMADTIVPRLIVAGADMKRIHFVQISENSTGTREEGVLRLDCDLPALEEMIKRHPDVVLIIPDPIIAFLGDADMNKDKDIRPIYSKMKAFAKRLNVAWLFVNHWNKNQTASSINRTSGAKTMVSAPRATWMFTRSPEDPNRYLMMKGKGNLSGNKTKTLAYRITGVPYDFGDGLPIDPDGVPKLVWDGETEHNTEDVLKDQNDPKTRRNTRAEELLSTLLKDGAKKAKDVYSAGDKENLDKNQMQRARYKLGYVAKPINGTWYWAKSEEDILRRKEQLFTPHPVTLRTKPDVDLDARVN